VLWNDTPTGMALPGGYIFLSTGLLAELKDESELAAVLAHEIAHVVHEDGLKMYERQLKAGFIPDVIAATGDKGRGLVKGYRGLWNEVAVNGYSRDQEVAADKASVRYLADAGYHPEGLLSFLKRAAQRPGLNHESGKQHPSPELRARALLAELAGLGDYSKSPKLADRYESEALRRIRALQPKWEREIKPQWERTKAEAAGTPAAR
jgi:predicted Zn-dependent protease